MNKSIRPKVWKGRFLAYVTDTNLVAFAKTPDDADKIARGMLSKVIVQLPPPQPPQRAA